MWKIEKKKKKRKKWSEIEGMIRKRKWTDGITKWKYKENDDKKPKVHIKDKKKSIKKNAELWRRRKVKNWKKKKWRKKGRRGNRNNNETRK